MTTTERRKLTEPLESVTGFFGMLMVLTLAIFAGLWAFGSGSFSGGPGPVCENQPGATYSGSWQTPYVSAKPGASIEIVGTIQACTTHPGIGQWVLYGLAEVPTIVAWCGVLLLLWRMIRVAGRGRPVHAGRCRGDAAVGLVHPGREPYRRGAARGIHRPAPQRPAGSLA